MGLDDLLSSDTSLVVAFLGAVGYVLFSDTVKMFLEGVPVEERVVLFCAIAVVFLWATSDT